MPLLAREIIVHYRVALATDKERRLKEGVSVGYVFWAHTVSNLSLWVQAMNLLNLAVTFHTTWFNLLKPAGYVMHQQFNIQQLYALPTLY